jgi:hypothetical protein
MAMSAITAGIDIAPTSIGRPEFAGNSAFGVGPKDPIPRAAFEAVRAIPVRGPRSPKAAEAATYALLQWEAPTFDPPAADSSGYRIERAAIGSDQWTVETALIQASGSLITATVSGVPSGIRHRFRITPLGTVDGTSTIVESVAKGGDTVAFVEDDVVHRYETVGSANFTLGFARAVKVLVAAGGASGTRGWCGYLWGHGGGGGGVSSADIQLAAGSYEAIVGAGGDGSVDQSCEFQHFGRNGGYSALASSQETLLIATGGLGAYSHERAGGASGTGTIDGQARPSNPGGVGTGGAPACNPGGCGAGGGGGAAGGGDVHSGGLGVTSTITGQTITYGQGGAGRVGGVISDPGEGARGPGGGGTDKSVGGFTAGNAGTVILRYTLMP